MISKKKIMIFIVALMLSCFISALTVGIILTNSYASSQYNILSSLTEYIVSQYPDSEQPLMKLIKENSLNHNTDTSNNTIFFAYGYTPKIFASQYIRKIILFMISFIPLLILLIFIMLMAFKNIYRLRISELTAYLEQANHKKDLSILSHKEDDFSKLQDEICKTVTNLRQTKEAAQLERKNLADNLADISHQIKTPIASISLMTQLLNNNQNRIYIEKIKNQTNHLEKLMEALLTLSRIDAGTLKLEKNKVDIYTLLQLSIDSLEELITQKKLNVYLENHLDLFFCGDMEWSIEAFINLIKNCAEHTPVEGSIKIEYYRTPLFVEIRIQDNGPGFSEKDLPHIFERFYQGENISKNGIGIGLSIAKAIIEQQNGMINAKNLKNLGACFIVRFYSH
jgi:signal transduction histidine kinase